MAENADRQEQSEESRRFETLVKGLFAVPKAELDAKLEEAKQAKKKTPKKS